MTQYIGYRKEYDVTVELFDNAKRSLGMDTFIVQSYWTNSEMTKAAIEFSKREWNIPSKGFSILHKEKSDFRDDIRMTLDEAVAFFDGPRDGETAFISKRLKEAYGESATIEITEIPSHGIHKDNDADTLYAAVQRYGRNIRKLERVLIWDNNRLRIAAEALASQNRSDLVVTILNSLDNKGRPEGMQHLGFVPKA